VGKIFIINVLGVNNFFTLWQKESNIELSASESQREGCGGNFYHTYFWGVLFMFYTLAHLISQIMGSEGRRKGLE